MRAATDPQFSPLRASASACLASRIAAFVVIALGGVVLLGWSFTVDVIKRLGTGMVAMNPLTAVCFVLGGAALILLQYQTPPAQRRIGRFLATIVLAIGSAKVAAIFFGWEFGLDQWLFHGQLFEPTTGRTNRMAPNTAFNFALAGAALLLVDVQTRRGTRPAEVLCTISAMCAIMAIVGYAYRVEVFYSIGQFIPMALHTAIGFVILAAGILLARTNKGTMGIIASDTAGGLLARRLLPLAVIVPVALGALRLAGERAGLYTSAFGVALFAGSNIVVFVALIWWTARLLFRIDTERKAAEAVKSEHEERFRQLAEHISDVFWIASLKPRRMLYVSPAYTRVWGRPVSGVYEDAGDWAKALHPEDRARVLEVMRHSRDSGYDQEYRILRPDGGVRWINDRAFPVRDSEGQIYRMVGSATDITAEKEAEQAMRAAKEEAERANRAKSEFLSRMSHELRTPLNAIIGFGQVLELDQLNDEQHDSVRHIVTAGRHLLDLINEVLDISRIESGGMALSLEPVSLSTLLNDVTMLVRPLAAQRQVRLLDLHNGDTEVFVTADRQRLKQVLLNLLSNAIKYNRQEGEVCVSIRSGADADEFVRIEITDTGIGLAPEKMARLFTPFDRLGAEQTSVEGTGLGLALSKRLVELMGGSIEAHSRPGSGSTFTIALRSAVDPVAVMEEEPAPVALQPTHEGKSAVLYIEDNLSNLRLVERVLRQRPDVKLIAAMQGIVGLDLAREHHPDVILLDLHLPDLHGGEVLQRLRANERTRHIPVVILTADATAREIARLKEAGADEYLTKPFDVARFLAIIDQRLAAKVR